MNFLQVWVYLPEGQEGAPSTGKKFVAERLKFIWRATNYFGLANLSAVSFSALLITLLMADLFLAKSDLALLKNCPFLI